MDQLSGGKIAYVHVPDTAVGGYIKFQPFLLCAGWQAGCGHRRALQPRRRNRGLHHRPSWTAAAQLRDLPRRREVLLAAGADLWAEDDGHQRNVRLRRRCAALDVQAGQSGPAGGHADLGRPGGHLGLPVTDGRRLSSPRREWRSTDCTANGKWKTTALRRTSKWKTIRRRWRLGTTAQLERAVQVTLEALKKNPVVIPDHPPYPNYHKK